MFIDMNLHKETIEKAFKIIYTYKDDAKQANAAANETLDNLVNEFSKGDKELSKEAKATLKVAFKEWVKLTETPDDSVTTDGVDIARELIIKE